MAGRTLGSQAQQDILPCKGCTKRVVVPRLQVLCNPFGVVRRLCFLTQGAPGLVVRAMTVPRGSGRATLGYVM